jgi:hypothetical protein
MCGPLATSGGTVVRTFGFLVPGCGHRGCTPARCRLGGFTVPADRYLSRGIGGKSPRPSAISIAGPPVKARERTANLSFIEKIDQAKPGARPETWGVPAGVTCGRTLRLRTFLILSLQLRPLKPPRMNRLFPLSIFNRGGRSYVSGTRAYWSFVVDGV